MTRDRRTAYVLLLLGLVCWLASGGCSDEPAAIDVAGYDLDCVRDSDCILVPVGNVCDPCAGANLAPIALGARDRYEAEVAAIGCADESDGPDACRPPPLIRAVCEATTCSTEPSACGDGVCDHYQWDPRETAVSCPDDCRCGDGVCDTTERTGAGACADDCPTTG